MTINSSAEHPSLGTGTPGRAGASLAKVPALRRWLLRALVLGPSTKGHWKAARSDPAGCHKSHFLEETGIRIPGRKSFKDIHFRAKIRQLLGIQGGGSRDRCDSEGD